MVEQNKRMFLIEAIDFNNSHVKAINKYNSQIINRKIYFFIFFIVKKK